MRKYLISESGSFYKANMHCHTIYSDGDKTPEEVKKIYQDMGYSIVAYTDHDIYLQHDELTDDKFLALHGFEMELGENYHPLGWRWMRCVHICLVSLKKDNPLQPMYNEKYLFGNGSKYKHLIKYDESLPPYDRVYTPEGVSEIMRLGREAGFFVTYNHPTWSRESYPDYTVYEGMHAMEMFNGGAIVTGFEDYNPRVYDDMLNAGKRIYCIGGDDNHNHASPESRNWDSGIAFTMIKAERLDYEAVAKSLVDGNFYCSEGPQIYALWLEDGRVHIDCSPADKIICIYQARNGGVAFDESGEGITSADFSASEEFGYFRITVIDKQGKHACTNAYFPDLHC